MNIKVFISLLLLWCFTLQANAENKEFETFAQQQSQAMHTAYEKKDTKAYNKLLTAFINRYEKLALQDKKFYSGYLNNAYYNLSCAYALLGQKNEAITYLDKSIKAGYLNYAHILEDTDFESIREEAGYKALVQSLRSIGDYPYILKQAATYNTNDKRVVPTFTYQQASNPNLVTLRKTLNLDSIAGKGNEVSKVINLMNWIHNLVPHDGNHGNPVVKNALSMINECKRDNRGLNCRGLATVLNECYLSMGIKSRFVTCLPKDSLGVDNDCHVINMVYINNLKKWIWIDPTFAAYVRDEKGLFLNLEEVRERLIANKPLILNPEANWNHKESQTKEHYLDYYMSKNLYMLECPVNSEYDTETQAQGKKLEYIQLIPLEYYKNSPDNKTTSTNNKSQVTYVKYATNNPATFWAPPAN
jgi:hypothetical protein